MQYPFYRFEDCAFPPVRAEEFASDLRRRRSDGFASKAEYVGALLDVLKMRKNLCLSRHFQQLDKESLFDTFRLDGQGATYLQGTAKRRAPRLVNFVPDLTYHICLSLPAGFTQHGARLLAKPCL